MLYITSRALSFLWGLPLTAVDGNMITISSTMRDLGVTMDNCLKFQDRTNLTITLGLISKIFQYKEP